MSVGCGRWQTVDTVIWWVRRDLRLGDNPALTAALERSSAVLPVFVVDPYLMGQPAEFRKRFLWAGLCELDEALRERGSRLVVREGQPLEVLSQLVMETGARAILAEEDYDPYARERDREVARNLPACYVAGPTLRHPEVVLKADGSPYRVFASYSRAWRSQSLPTVSAVLAAPVWLGPPPAGLWSMPLSATPSPAGFPAGEREAQKRLGEFTGGASPPVWDYARARDRLDMQGTSLLSPYLRFGMISARQAFAAAGEAIRNAPDPATRRGGEVWMEELIWREFFQAVLYHFPAVLDRAFRADMWDIPWQNDPQAFEAWREGRTGYPVVDAAMRQLRHTGWMHNRARMIAASFLVKDLLVDWQWGERWFMQCLVDGDPAANNGGWQWTAGVGTDAAPYFRVFNPVVQGGRFDPEGDYVRHWVPEIRRVPRRWVHTPWRMPREVQADVKCIVGRDYPRPIVDHDVARLRALAAYGRKK